MRWIIPFLLFTSVASAQNLDVQKLISALQQQRNDALDKAAMAEARAAQLSDELQRLKAEKPPDNK